MAHFLLVEFLALPGHHSLSMGPGRDQPCLSPSELTHICEVANARGVVRSMQAGDVLFAAGEPADAVCVVLEGSLSCYDAATTRVQRVRESGARSRQQDTASSRAHSRGSSDESAGASQGAGNVGGSAPAEHRLPRQRRHPDPFARLAQGTPGSERNNAEDSDTGRTGSPRSLFGPGLLVQDRHDTSALGLTPESALSSSSRRGQTVEQENHMTARVRRSGQGNGATEEDARAWRPSAAPQSPSPPTLELAVPESGEGVAHCRAGCVVGGIAAVTGTQHRESAVCLHPHTKIAVLPIALLHELAERESQQHLSEGGATSVLSVVQGVVRHMCPLLDAFLGAGPQRVWHKAGQILYAQDDPANSLYVVISGRVRAIMQRATPLGAFPRRAREHMRHTSSREQPNAAAAAAAHYADDVILSGGVDVGRGESIGELSLLSSSRKRCVGRPPRTPLPRALPPLCAAQVSLTKGGGVFPPVQVLHRSLRPGLRAGPHLPPRVGNHRAEAPLRAGALCPGDGEPVCGPAPGAGVGRPGVPNALRTPAYVAPPQTTVPDPAVHCRHSAHPPSGSAARPPATAGAGRHRGRRASGVAARARVPTPPRHPLWWRP